MRRGIRHEATAGSSPWVGPAQGIDSAIEDCINSAVSLNRSPFQSFQPFNRFASFKALRRFKSSRFKSSRNKQLDRNFQVSGTDGSVTVAVTCIGFSRPRNAWVCLSSIIRLTSNHVHLLVNDTGSDVIAQSMQLIAGRTAQEYIQRKGRQGAF
jgi:hypothetical protein